MPRRVERAAAGADADHYDFFEPDHFNEPGYPKMYFMERRRACDPTTWWAPNAVARQAMPRSAGFEIVDHPEEKVYVCRWVERQGRGPRAVYPARGEESRPGVTNDRGGENLEQAQRQVALDPQLDPERDRRKA